MGFIAATDDHNGVPGNTAEDTWPGHAGRGDDTPARRIGATADGGSNGVDHGHNPGGVAVVWAEQNTRDAIFAALYRRETYATSGPRIVVRFYQTWNLASDPCLDPNFPEQLVAAGAVPMGGTMSPAPADAGSGPWLVAYAWKDIVDLEEIDLVKGTLLSDGGIAETVTRNMLDAGTPGCWSVQDTAFTPAPTAYYVRVLQQPTPRWSAYDCATDPTLNPAGCADGGYLNRTIRERAWTSPIWYLP
jgi:hypothetical protein